MELSKNRFGSVTQQIMDQVDERIPDLPPHVYNRVCEAVLAGLKEAKGFTVVPDNDWAFRAIVMEMSVESRQEFYKLCRQLFPEMRS